MKIGTKSILFGSHCFLIHPIFVFWAWWKLYGFPYDPRLWLAFFVHDLGYWGKSNMDGQEGERHVELGAKIMGIFGKQWHDFTLYHSKYYAKKRNAKPSKLCYADKLAICLEPRWLYLFMANLSTEIVEYMEDAKYGKYAIRKTPTDTQTIWLINTQKYLTKWVYRYYGT